MPVAGGLRRIKWLPNDHAHRRHQTATGIPLRLRWWDCVVAICYTGKEEPGRRARVSSRRSHRSGSSASARRNCLTALGGDFLEALQADGRKVAVYFFFSKFKGAVAADPFQNHRTSFVGWYLTPAKEDGRSAVGTTLRRDHKYLSRHLLLHLRLLVPGHIAGRAQHFNRYG